MFIGHAAVAALAAAARPRVPLLPLLLAAYAADVVEIILDGVGISRTSAMLWSHSVTALVAGGAIAATVAALATRRSWLAVLVGLVYLSHGLCDLLTGQRKPAWAGGPTYGLGLYKVPLADFAIEVGLVLLAAVLYQWRRPVPRRRLVATVILLVLLQLGFNLGDRALLYGLKHDLIRITGEAYDSATAS